MSTMCQEFFLTLASVHAVVYKNVPHLKHISSQLVIFLMMHSSVRYL